MPRWWIAGPLVFGLCISSSVRADPDYESCKDVFVTRLAGFHIQECTDKTLDRYAFAKGTPKEARVEGHITDTYYRVDEGKQEPSALAVRRNYEAVFKQGGWTVVYADSDTLTATQAKDGEQRWVQLASNAGNFYELVSAQKGALEQPVTTAEGMLSALDREGHVALHINFDIGKASVSSDSQDLVAQVSLLLQNHPQLNLSVEGHTDNVGDAKASKGLSEARARAVVALLVSQGVDATRLSASGLGPEHPVADNSTEEGRAKNRRVELVKR
jgi:OOP family OmpA-OmpF porin